MILSIYIQFFLLFIISIHSQQLQWILLSDGQIGGNVPSPRRDAALGFDSSFLILYGGRDQSGMPTQDTFTFNILQGRFQLIEFI